MKNTRKSSFSMNKKFSLSFSKKVLGEKFVCFQVLHHFSKFEELRSQNKQKIKINSRDRVGPFNHSGMLSPTLELKMAELRVFHCSRRTSLPVY